MSVGFGSYEIARTGLSVSEQGLNVTGHNISNVNTPGYVRQQLMIASAQYRTEYSRDGMYQLGLGADVEQIRQIRHTFLDNVYRQENTTLGYWESRNKTFQDIQAILGEPMGSGLQNVMNQFWDAWQELSKDPASLTVRALVRQRGEDLVLQVNHLGQQLDKMQEDLNSEIQVRINEVNDITAKIAQLNLKIMTEEVSGDRANDYRDQRNALVDRLSKLVDADVTEMQDGQLAITLGGYFLVNKDEHTSLYAAEDSTGGLFYVPKLEGTDMEVPVKSGIIKGLMESRGEVFGAKGSTENGSPNTKADITFVVDNSAGSGANLEKIKASINKYVDELKSKGLDFNLRLVTFGSSSSMNSMVWDKSNIDAAGSSFAEAVNAITENTGDSGNNFDDSTGVVSALVNTPYRQDASRYAVVFTGESIGGDEGTEVDAAAAAALAASLNAAGVSTSIVAPEGYFTSGAGAGDAGWNSIADATGGKLYSMDSANLDGVMASINKDINSDVNGKISSVGGSSNIIPDLRKRLNALVNIMAREVNALHRSGTTMGNPGGPGDDFFTVINSAYPMEMGNIKLNDNLSDLNNIVASSAGSNGDNTVALSIANLRNESVMKEVNKTLSLDEYYQSIILKVGSGGSEASRISESQLNLVNSADASRKSIAEVSMDEEMTNMMKYKYAYDASSRVLNAIDEMIDTIISRMGLAGR
ncbi:MAG: flagellar hook-associated protein FlgK [Clostridiales bacterium]|jgi:flagellar hook-associated protein 1 FlgK|nr:flagellar hook-associated protein FlgK [Eubacteriales bacterium]MDH7566172.1 flagellar hook-associated protein FlgK [Clostridiales bacterium]